MTFNPPQHNSEEYVDVEFHLFLLKLNVDE